tara:strand:+ start:80 stop:451 length:372 start_codon:yes stop_codon:yes gene_type:complete
MLKIPPKSSASRCATAAVTEGGKVTKVMSPITGEPEIVGRVEENLVPLTTSLKMVCAQSGTYSSLHVSVTTTSLHPDGNMEARQQALDADINWALDALDKHAANFNAIRYALGQSGEWKPSGR